MGRAIRNENKIDELEHRLVLVEDALEELVIKGTKVKHVTKSTKKLAEVADSEETS